MSGFTGVRLLRVHEYMSKLNNITIGGTNKKYFLKYPVDKNICQIVDI